MHHTYTEALRCSLDRYTLTPSLHGSFYLIDDLQPPIEALSILEQVGLGGLNEGWGGDGRHSLSTKAELDQAKYFVHWTHHLRRHTFEPKDMPAAVEHDPLVSSLLAGRDDASPRTGDAMATRR